MRSLVTIVLFISLLHAQNDFTKLGFGIKAYTGAIGFIQPNIKAPMPAVGITASLICNTTEIELGAGYLPKLWEKNISSQPGYKKIMYGEHYINAQIGVHQKIFQEKKHVFSASASAIFQFYVANSLDTVMTDGSTRYNGNPTLRAAISTCSMNMEISLRYTYVISKNLGFFVAPFLTARFTPNYQPLYSSPGGVWGVATYRPPEENFSLGLKVGIHFLVHFQKDSPVRFFHKEDVNAKEYRHGPL